MSMPIITAADTGSILTFDAKKNVINNTKGVTHLFDAMGREYKNVDVAISSFSWKLTVNPILRDQKTDM